MKSKLYFSCFYEYENKIETLANRIKVENIEYILSMLSILKNKAGSARLEYIPEPDIGISDLWVRSDGGKYLFTLKENGNFGGEDFILRIPNKPIFSSMLISFEGELYPSENIVNDFNFVEKVFSILLKEGDIPHKLMKNIYEI